jgi:hypothetical protein
VSPARSPDGKLEAVLDGAWVELREVATGRVRWRGRHGTVAFSGSGDPYGFPDETRDALALAVAFGGDGTLISVGEGEAAPRWDVDTGAPRGSLEVDGWTRTTAIAVSPAGWVVTGDARGGLRRFAPDGAKPVAELRLAAAVAIATLAIDPDGDRITAVDAGGNAHRIAVRGDRLVIVA